MIINIDSIDIGSIFSKQSYQTLLSCVGQPLNLNKVVNFIISVYDLKNQNIRNITRVSCINECRIAVIITDIHISTIFNEQPDNFLMSWKWIKPWTLIRFGALRLTLGRRFTFIFTICWSNAQRWNHPYRIDIGALFNE